MTSPNTEKKRTEFFARGWCQFEFDSRLSNWVKSALPAAQASVIDEANRKWLRCGDTWFAGVNVLPNASDGSIDSDLRLELKCDVVDFITEALGLSDFSWDKAQVSVCYSGYPQRMDTETEAAFVFRRDRDAAHVDGLLPEGVNRRRFLREWHGFILAIPMLEYDAGASPFVVWEGSQEIVRQKFQSIFQNKQAGDWPSLDITEDYHDVRHHIFKACKRVEIVAKPGEAYLVHRLALHGVAPWKTDLGSTCKERMICYFRPETGGVEQWLREA
jgi:hypothetical protein